MQVIKSEGLTQPTVRAPVKPPTGVITNEVVLLEPALMRRDAGDATTVAYKQIVIAMGK